MHFSHLFDLVQINNETPLVGVVFLDALPAENSEVI